METLIEYLLMSPGIMPDMNPIRQHTWGVYITLKLTERRVSDSEARVGVVGPLQPAVPRRGRF
jgi:hypothetical protein